jgi:hypothetical protein
VVKSVEKKKSVAGHFGIKYKTKPEDYGVDRSWVLLALLKE